MSSAFQRSPQVASSPSSAGFSGTTTARVCASSSPGPGSGVLGHGRNPRCAGARPEKPVAGRRRAPRLASSCAAMRRSGDRAGVHRGPAASSPLRGLARRRTRSLTTVDRHVTARAVAGGRGRTAGAPPPLVADRRRRTRGRAGRASRCAPRRSRPTRSTCCRCPTPPRVVLAARAARARRGGRRPERRAAGGTGCVAEELARLTGGAARVARAHAAARARRAARAAGRPGRAAAPGGAALTPSSALALVPGLPRRRRRAGRPDGPARDGGVRRWRTIGARIAEGRDLAVGGRAGTPVSLVGAQRAELRRRPGRPGLHPGRAPRPRLRQPLAATSPAAA